MMEDLEESHKDGKRGRKEWKRLQVCKDQRRVVGYARVPGLLCWG